MKDESDKRRESERVLGCGDTVGENGWKRMREQRKESHRGKETERDINTEKGEIETESDCKK